MKLPTPDITIESGAVVIPITRPYREIWNQEARNAILYTARHHQHFTAADVKNVMTDTPHRGNLGPLLASYARKGYFHPTGHYIDTDNGPAKVWESAVFEGLAS